MKTKLSFLARSVILLWMLVVGSFNAQASITSDGNTYIYIKNFKPSGWTDCWKCPLVEVYCYFYTGAVNDWSNKAELVSGTENGIDAIYRVNVPSGTWSTIIITRGIAPSWDEGKIYNQSGDITIPDNKNYIQTFAEGSTSATWDFYSTNFTVTYNGNGSDIGDVPATSTADDEGHVTIAGQGTLGRTGYSFVNWNTNPDGSGNSYSPEATPTINSNLTLYAQWEELMHTVTVSAGDNGRVNITSASVGISTNATIIATPDDDYRFVSWTKTGNVTIANVNDATTTITATGDDATVTANFEKIPEYVDITVAVRTTGKAKEFWNSDEATTAYFWEPDRTFPGDEVTSKLTYDGHKYFYKTYTVPYGGTLKICVHNIASPTSSMYDTRSEEICIENVTTDKTYYYSLGAWKETNPGLSYSIFTTEDDSGYYLVVNNTRHAGVPGKDIVKYKFQPVLIREMANPELSETLYTLTLPDFVLTGAQKRAENPNCFESGTMYYTIQKGDGSVIYQPGNNYQLGYESGKVTENSNGNLTNVQMESYGANIKKSKSTADAEGYNFFLEKSTLAKSYTWYLNIGTTAYAPSDNYPRFTSYPQSVAIAANQLVEGHTKNAIVEQNNASGVQDYYLTGNLKFGGNNPLWEPVENKMKMTRMFFLKGKSYVAGSTPDVTEANCDSIVYVLQMVRPTDGWGNMFLSMAGERNLDAFKDITNSNLVAWWATLIRPQVFTNMDAQWNFGGLEVNGILNDDGTYTTSYGNTSQAINPILDETVTGYTAYFNMTNATYRLVYYTETNSNDEGLFIIGPAVAKDGEIDGDETYHAADGRKVKLSFNPVTGAYEAIGIKLTNGQKFRFANIKQTTTVKTEGGYETSSEMKSAYESYYDEDEIVPARDGEPGNEAWIDAETWETDYFNRLSKLKNADDVQEITDGTPVKFELPTGTYNVRFYTKYLGENNETVTNAYYTIDYHIGIGDAEAFGTDLNKGAGSAFAFHKTWSSRLAYVNNGLDAYYVSGWTWNKDEQKKTATASVTLSTLTKPKYLVARKAMILTDGALNPEKKYVIVPGDPYGYSSDVTACDFNNTNDNGISVRPIYETENYETGMKSEKNSDAWKKWSSMVGPGAFDGEKYTTRNFTFAMIVPTWNTEKKKELDFWRVKSTNEKMTGHKFLVVASVPDDTNDLESGKAFSSYQSGSNAKSMANYMTIRFEGEDDEVDSIVTGIAENIAEKADNGRIYNLMGVEVKTPVRGQVYIINGRKAIMK